MDDRAVHEQVARVERALEALESLPAEPRKTALDALALLLDLYGEGWSRALSRLEETCPSGARSLAEDELISHLLLIHGLHPEGVESRVAAALEEIRAVVNSDGLDVELVELAGGVAHLRFDGNGHAPESGLRDLVRQAVLGAAPELEQVDVELPPGARNGGPALVQLRRATAPADGTPSRGKDE